MTSVTACPACGNDDLEKGLTTWQAVSILSAVFNFFDRHIADYVRMRKMDLIN